jgi:hypothetical protein
MFEHKVFQLKGARFAMTEDGTQPAFHVDLGALVAALVINTVRSEFGINEESPDGILLSIVEKSLRFVKEIRPGDSIPRELLDGTASWSVEERHRTRARAHLWARAIGSQETKGADDQTLRRFNADPKIEERLKERAAFVADQLGDNLDADAVLGRIDDVARELAYIEALQERCGEVLAIVPKLTQISRAYRGDRGVLDELSRIRTLLLRPIEMYDGIFARLGQRQEEVSDVVRKYQDQIEFIREQRDDVHQSMMMWDPILAAWKNLEPSRCTETESKIAELYRFIARHFLARQEWSKGAA